MFCPKCKSEYRDGFTECADCCIALVRELSTEPAQMEYVDFKELLTTNDQGEIALFKSILKSEDIPFLAQGDHFSTTQAYGMTVRFLVPKEYLEQAGELLKEFI
jgi:hypothetical protein